MVENERRANFVRLAESRVNRAISDLRLIGNLSNRSNYSYEKTDINKIISVIEKEVRALKKRFEETDYEKNTEFKL